MKDERGPTNPCDIIVIGAGHAGCEAALASARMGMNTILLTTSLDTIAKMPCNPAIGGLAKGQLVREVDALGGEMGRAIDATGIQFRMLNTRKGPAVRSPRAQADKPAYSAYMRRVLEAQKNLTIVTDMAQEIVPLSLWERARVRDEGSRGGAGKDAGAPRCPLSFSEKDGARGADSLSLWERAGVRVEEPPPDAPRGKSHKENSSAAGEVEIRGDLPAPGWADAGPGGFEIACASGRKFLARAVVLAAGTFLNGLVHIGSEAFPSGRDDEPPATGISDSLRRLGFQLGRLKTGTPPRVHRDSIDYSRVAVQPGDACPQPFSFSTGRIEQQQIPCFITYTNPSTHEIIRRNLDRAPLYTGQIKSVGPRYCPSIETKIVRFADKDRHQIFLEPEGRDSEIIYCNGISTSVPRDVQDEMVRSIEGLENARILRHGYAIEYDFAFPTQLFPTLETKLVPGLFFAGQINGTSGYEEAAAQGIVAGINAALRLKNEPPLVLGRDEAYIGVMIDDLVTRGVTEPYRMFTSRAEYRLILRQDNADRRLMKHGHRVGLISEGQWSALCAKEERIAALLAYLEKKYVGEQNLAKLLRRPETRFEELEALDPGLAALVESPLGAPGSQECRPLGAPASVPAAFIDGIPMPRQEKIPVSHEARAVKEQIEIELKYQGYLKRQMAQIARFRELEEKPLPARLDYSRVPHLRAEAREKLSEVRPISLGQAARVSGVRPADISILMVYLKGRAVPVEPMERSSRAAEPQAKNKRTKERKNGKTEEPTNNSTIGTLS